MPINQPHTSANYAGGTHIVNAKGTGYRNNGGTVFYGGTVPANAPITQSLGVAYLGHRSGISETKPIYSSDRETGTAKALSAGQFANMVPGQYIIFGNTQKLANVANTLLSITGSYGRGRNGQNNSLSYVRTTHYVLGGDGGGGSAAGGWDYVTGRPKTQPLVTTVDSIGVETYPGTYSIPGRITFFPTGKLATTVSYSAKND
jgi:hypothetical protein